MTAYSMCEACLNSHAEREIETEVADRPFKLCLQCAYRLENLALRPLEWYRLAVIHGPLTHLLHDDFYDEDGSATQNDIPVDQPGMFPVPKLEELANDLDKLLDYSMTRWNLDVETIAALRRHEASEVLARISRLVEDGATSWVESRCYVIAARVLGPLAEQWVRSRWGSGSQPNQFYSFMKAVAACTPHEEAIPLALTAIEKSGQTDLSFPAMALADFHSPIVLDWIESFAKSPVSDRWGHLAACSCLSWETATRWLDQGRPMSLVAMDALGVIMRPDLYAGHSLQPTKLQDAPSHEEVIARLRQHALRDPVPRVTQMVDRIIGANPKS